MAKKILIIGAGGYLGTHFILYFINQQYEVTALCHRKSEMLSERSQIMKRLIYGDITSEETRREIADDDYDYVIYLVSLNQADSCQSPVPVCHTNVLPLWETGMLLKGKVKKFIYFSTQQIYGQTQNPVISENDIAHPVNQYGLTHLLCEDIIRYLNTQSETQFLNVRLSNGYGAPVLTDSNGWELVINDLCRNAVTEQCIRLQSDGSPQRDFIYIEDILSGIDTLLKTNHPLEDTYNLASGQSYTIGEIALFTQEMYERINEKKIPILLPEGKSLVTTPVSRIRIDTQRINSLGFSPEYDIKKGIFSVIAMTMCHY